jgi:uncharacterized repeat protein (TIGR03803 family)
LLLHYRRLPLARIGEALLNPAREFFLPPRQLRCTIRMMPSSRITLRHVSLRISEMRAPGVIGAIVSLGMSKRGIMIRQGQHQHCISALAIGAMFVTALIGTPAAQAQTYTVLHRFTGADGRIPSEYGHLIEDPAGNFYGTTVSGGASNWGVVFKLDTTGTETVLHSFTGSADGGYPLAGLIRDSAGNLYGTTQSAGIGLAGVVFKVDTAGTETVLYAFTGGADGAYPLGGLVRDSAGNLYGTASGGGASSQGAVFKVDTTGTETVLYSFTGGEDGGYPLAGLTQDSAGNLYGTTSYGGSGRVTSGDGVVFMLKP